MKIMLAKPATKVTIDIARTRWRSNRPSPPRRTARTAPPPSTASARRRCSTARPTRSSRYTLAPARSPSHSRCRAEASVSSALTLTTNAARLVIDDPAGVVELKVAAVQQLLLELRARPLHPRFRAGERDAQALAQGFLAQALIRGQPQRLAVGHGQRIHHRGHAGQQFAHQVVIRQIIRRDQRLR